MTTNKKCCGNCCCKVKGGVPPQLSESGFTKCKLKPPHQFVSISFDRSNCPDWGQALTAEEEGA